jgi:hypothetical protein
MSQHSHLESQHQGTLPGSFVWCGAVGLMGIVGLFVAARAGHGMPYYGGLTFFVFAVLFVFLMIKRGFDRAEGLVPGGLPLFVRTGAAVAIGYLLHGLAAESLSDQATLIGVAAAVVVFAILAAIDRIAIRAE